MEILFHSQRCEFIKEKTRKQEKSTLSTQKQIKIQEKATTIKKERNKNARVQAINQEILLFCWSIAWSRAFFLGDVVFS